jgi:hypothetical protein
MSPHEFGGGAYAALRIGCSSRNLFAGFVFTSQSPRFKLFALGGRQQSNDRGALP